MYIKRILIAIALIGLVAFGYFAWYVYSIMLVPNTVFTENQAFINIPTNATYTEVRTRLKPLLKDINTFDALANRKQYVQNIKPGRYRILKNMTNNAIINSIRSNNIPVTVTFNNQPSLAALAGRISQQIEADSTTLLKTMRDSNFLKTNNFNSNTAIAMYLPNSYEFFWNTSADEFCNRMLKEYNNFWNTERLEKARAIDLSPTEIITLAAIVSEESKKTEEQPRIAGVYINRLRAGMPLQADPTLKFAAYQLPEYQNVTIKRVLNVHKTIDSPYNTYKYIGLPPGPITMPDLSAINAVLNYENHDYYYFAADAKRLGYHKFAKTLAQHNANARAYQAYLSSQGIF